MATKYNKKIDDIYEHVSNIRVDVASIDQHLEALNGRVSNHRKRIQTLEKESQSNKLLWAKIIGAGAVIGAVSSFILTFVVGGL